MYVCVCVCDYYFFYYSFDSMCNILADPPQLCPLVDDKASPLVTKACAGCVA